MGEFKIIKNDEEYQAVMRRIEDLFDAKQGTEDGEELELLAALVEIYEKENYPIDDPDPISAIKFRMEQLGLNRNDLVDYIGSKSKVSEVLSGKRPLSLNMIRRLHEGLNIPAEVLLKETSKTLPDSSIMKHGRKFPFTEMYRLGWFKDFFSGSLSEAKGAMEEILLSFIGPFKINDFSTCFNRKTEKDDDSDFDDILLAWRIRVMNLAAKDKLSKWNASVLDDSFFSELAHLSYFEDGPRLACEFLNKSGIHFIIEEHLKKTHMDGSSMIMPDGSPLIALTLRYDRLDSFWFTLFHELAHVKLHLTEQNLAFFDDITNEMNREIEKEADSFAKQKLISDYDWQLSGLNVFSSTAAVRYFAETRRISPAIPAGRLRFENKNYRVFSGLVGNAGVRRLFAG